MKLLNNDVLQTLNLNDIIKLKDALETHLPESAAAYNFLKNCINWKIKAPHENYYTVMASENHWEETCTFICLIELHSYDLYLFTLEESHETLFRSLINTKRIDWTRRLVICAIHENHVETVKKALKEINVQVNCGIPGDAWMLEKEKGAQFEIECAQETYITKLTRKHVLEINDLWPHKYPGSEEHMWTFVKMNYGFGLFLKNDNTLIAWAVKNHFGVLGVLQVNEEHSNNGYGQIMAKLIAKQLADENIDTVGYVMKVNRASQKLLEKLGFRILYPLEYLYINHAPDVFSSIKEC